MAKTERISVPVTEVTKRKLMDLAIREKRSLAQITSIVLEDGLKLIRPNLPKLVETPTDDEQA
jgi:hypothetical protein